MEHVDSVTHTRKLIVGRENVNNLPVVTEHVNFLVMQASKNVQNIQELLKIARFVNLIHAH